MNKNLINIAEKYELAVNRMDKLISTIEESCITIFNPDTAVQMFSGLAERSAEKVMTTIMYQQQEQIRMLTEQTAGLTELVSKLLTRGITITTEEVVTKTITQEMKTEIKVPTRTAQFTWVLVPTTESGRIKWKNTEMSEINTCLQILHELEKWNGIDITAASNIDPSIYMGIKTRTKGILWKDLVENSRRYGKS